MVFCSECGTENYKDAKHCTSCGKEIRVYLKSNKDSSNQTINNQQEPQKVSIKAFTSLLFGILSIVFIFIISSVGISILLAIMGIIFGVVGMNEVNQEAKGIVRLGIILSAFTLIFFIFISM